MKSTTRHNSLRMAWRASVVALALSAPGAFVPGGLGVSAAQAAGAPLPYQNPALGVEARLQDLLGRMTLEEKASLLSGAGWMETQPIKRLGIPALKVVDGPLGVRAWMASSAETNVSASNLKVIATSFPSGISLAATWDPTMSERMGQAIAQQAKALGRDMVLGPTVNINRMPLWGRNFEGYGEDPYLSGRIAVGFVKGAQGEGIIATVKHLAANNMEWHRRSVDEQIDSRTLHEIYLPAFKAAIQDGGAWAVMSAYNKVNGQNCSENEALLTGVLRREWGFKGLVISDWGSTYATEAPINAGLDLEMPGGPRAVAMLSGPSAKAERVDGLHMTREKVLAALKAGRIKPATVTARAADILRVMIANGLLDHQHEPGGALDTPAQQAVARDIATESIVLLKNEGGVLPLDSARVHKIAVIGPSAATARTGGGGSSLVRPEQAISPLQGLRERAGKDVEIDYALGVSMSGEDPAKDTSAARARQLAQAVDLAAKADVAIVVVGRSTQIESEAFDQTTMDLPSGQDALIQAVARANPRTVVVLNTGNPVTMTEWLDKVPGLVDLWYAGQEGGHALAAVLFGDANPSGKLPVTFPKTWEDSPVYGNYPGDRNYKTTYKEGIYVGYRYYDTKNVDPLFPFGYGLSYTNFVYDGLNITPTTRDGQTVFAVDFSVTNTGSRSGAEVAQLYVHDDHASVDRPLRELKGFERVELKAGEKKTLHFVLDRSALSYYSPQKAAWIAEPGQFQIQIGSSSRDIRVAAPLVLKQ